MGKCIFFFIFCLFSQIVFAAPQVAKVLILKGSAKMLDPDTGKSTALSRGMWVKEGSKLSTSPKSFVKLLFKDKSSINLGPKSEMEISKFPQKEAGVLTLIKGQIRSKVQKDLLEENKDKSKMFIKTKTAAMGVRGTDFEVMFNEKTQNTAVVTYEGEVVMAQLPPTLENNFVSQESLEQAVSGDQAVSVREGQFAGSSKVGRPNQPIKINPAQFNTLKENEGIVDTGEKKKERKNFQSPIPPGVSTKQFVNQQEGLVESLGQVVGAEAVQEVVANVDTQIQEVNFNAPPPEGFKSDDGSFAPPSGGLIDLNTGTYVAPPPGSPFDPVTQTYTPPPEFGGFDPASGGFIPPEGVVLSDDQVFVAENNNLTAQPTANQLAPGTQPPPPAPGKVYIPIIADVAGASEFAQNMDTSVGDWDNQVQGDLAHHNIGHLPPPGTEGPLEPAAEGSDPCEVDANLCNVVDDLLQNYLQNNIPTDDFKTTTVNFNIST